MQVVSGLPMALLFVGRARSAGAGEGPFYAWMTEMFWLVWLVLPVVYLGGFLSGLLPAALARHAFVAGRRRGAGGDGGHGVSGLAVAHRRSAVDFRRLAAGAGGRFDARWRATRVGLQRGENTRFQLSRRRREDLR